VLPPAYCGAQRALPRGTAGALLPVRLLAAAAAELAAGGARTLPGLTLREAYSYTSRAVPFYCL